MVISSQIPVPESEATLPGAYLWLFLQRLLPERNRRAAVLATLGLSESAPPPARLELNQIQAVIRALDSELEPGWHLAPSTDLDPAQHGPVGLAVISAATVGQALDTLVRFEPLRMPWIGLHVRRGAGRMDILLKANQDLGDCEALLMEINLLALAGIAGRILGAAQDELTSALPGHERPWQDELEARLPGVLVFGSDDFCLSVPLRRIDQPCLLADKQLHDLMTDRCRTLERELEKSSLTARVRRLLLDQGGNHPGLDQIARRLGHSSRSLSRHLAAEGCDYRTLVDQIRQQIAEQLIRHSNLPIARIADRLGYADPSNFNRAFRRWTGSSPGSLRKTRN